MAHQVTFTLPERELGKADVEFQIKMDDEILGKLLVSKGGVEWVPRNKQYGIRCTWAKFDTLMQESRADE